MYGRNEVHGQFASKQGTLKVNDIFYTLQGEGPDAGVPAVFLRLSKCNLRCFFCDTEFETGEFYEPRSLAEQIVRVAKPYNCRLVVITGGEPLLQNIIPLVDLLNRHGMRVSVETAGTVWIDGLYERFDPVGSAMSSFGNLIVVSPKTPKINPKIEKVMAALKYIVDDTCLRSDDGLPVMSTQIKGKEDRVYRRDQGLAHIPIYVQPMDVENPVQKKNNIHAARDIALRYGYRLSLQTHKIVGLP